MTSAPKGRLWGYSFGDFIYKVQGDTLYWGKTEYAGLKKNSIGSNLRRLYLGYDYKITENFVAKVLMEGTGTTLTSDGKFTFAIKTGYLEWNNFVSFLPNASVKLGLIPTPIFNFPEKTWGYRSVEKDALDLRGLGKLVDQGFSFSTDFDKDKNSGLTFFMGNGTGNKPGIDKYLEYSGSIYKKFYHHQITLELMGDYLQKNEQESTAILRGFFSIEKPSWTYGMELL